MNNEQLYDAALAAIQELFSDQSVSRADARRNLETLKGEMNIMIDTLQDDEEITDDDDEQD